MAKAAQTTTLEIPAIDLKHIQVPIIGETPLICHAWSAKAKKELLDQHMKKAKKPKEAKDPWADFCDTLYWLDGKPAKPTEQDVEKARFGFPAIAFKGAAITAVTTISSMTKVMARQCFHITGEFVEILGPPPKMREDITRVGMGKPDTRFRAEFDPWGVILPVQYNAGVMSAEQVFSLFRVGGFGVGVGDWRPERDGVYGRFRIASTQEMEQFK